MGVIPKKAILAACRHDEVCRSMLVCAIEQPSAAQRCSLIVDRDVAATVAFRHIVLSTFTFKRFLRVCLNQYGPKRIKLRTQTSSTRLGGESRLGWEKFIDTHMSAHLFFSALILHNAHAVVPAVVCVALPIHF